MVLTYTLTITGPEENVMEAMAKLSAGTSTAVETPSAAGKGKAKKVETSTPVAEPAPAQIQASPVAAEPLESDTQDSLLGTDAATAAVSYTKDDLLTIATRFIEHPQIGPEQAAVFLKKEGIKKFSEIPEDRYVEMIDKMNTRMAEDAKKALV